VSIDARVVDTAPFSRDAFHRFNVYTPHTALSTRRDAGALVGVATYVSIVTLLYDILKYRLSRSMDGDLPRYAGVGVEFLVGRRLDIAFSHQDQYVAVSDLSRHVGIDGVFFPIPKSSVELL